MKNESIVFTVMPIISNRYISNNHYHHMYIFVLESLGKKDPQTGQLIHQYLTGEGISNEFHAFRSKQQLLDLLEVVKLKCATDDIQPFIHFDCHGNANGLLISKSGKSTELITWNELQDAFIEIFKASKRKSVICFSSCKGFNAAKMVASMKPCPYGQISGSFKSIAFDKAFESYAAFYQQIAGGKDVYQSAVAVHNDRQWKEVEFLALNSSQLFTLMIDGYRAQFLTAAAIEKRKTWLFSQYINPSILQRKIIDQILSPEGQEKKIDQIRETFFSLD